MKTCPCPNPCPRNPEFCADCADAETPAPETAQCEVCAVEFVGSGQVCPECFENYQAKNYRPL